MSEELNKSISAKDENAIDTVEQEEEYIEWLAFAKTDFNSAKYLEGAPFHPNLYE